MGCLQFNGTSDYIRWSTLATALQNVTDGAWTIAALVKRDSTGNYDGIAALLSGTPGSGTTEAGIGFDGANQNWIYVDPGYVQFTTALTDTTNPYIVAVSKAAGSATPRLAWKLGSGGSWSHENAGATIADQIASSHLEIGVLSGEELPAHVGVIGIWEGAMSDANKEALDNNWQTSDWWGNAHGQPQFLCEFNVAAGSLTDLAGNASGLSSSGTTLDGAETLNSWNFDGQGVTFQEVRPDADVTTTGWTTTPLYSKINDESDATVITATAS